MIRKLTRDLRSASEPYLRVEREGTPVMSNPPAGWYPDPDKGTLLRYWDGSKWTPYHASAQPDGWYPDPENSTLLRYWEGDKSESVVATRPRSARTKTYSAEPPLTPIDPGNAAARRRSKTVGAIIAAIFLIAVVVVLRPGQHGGSTSSPPEPPSVAPSITFEGMRDFVTGYYNDLPAHPYDAWAKLSPRHDQTPQPEFVEFWATIQSVTLISISPRDATSVVARLRYVRNDGGSDTEDRWLKIVLVQGAMRLDGSGRIGSVDETQPLPQPTFSLKAIDRVLLTADHLSTVLGIHVTNDPSAGGPGTLTMKSSSYGPSDHSSQVTPRSCVGLVFTGDHNVYSATDFAAMKTQTFGDLYGSSSGREPYLLEQAAVVFASAEQAQGFLTSSQAQWDVCSKGEVDADLGFENGRAFVLGNVQSEPNLITVTMASNGGLNGPDACQQALGVLDNVVVEARTCEVPDVTTTYDPVRGWPKDPGWAVPDAERVAKAMLENVTP